MSRNVLVTGGSGFLGSYLVEKLVEQGDTVIPLNRTFGNLEDRWGLEQHFVDQTFDAIYHLAVNTKAGDWCETHSFEQWTTNQTMNTNIVDYWVTCQPQAKFITMGTSCSYDPLLGLEESNYLRGNPDKDLRYYAMTKRMLLEGLRAASLQKPELQWMYLIPSTLVGTEYGPNDNHFIFDLVRKIIGAKFFEDAAPVLWGDGHQERELVTLEDFVRDMQFLERRGDVWNSVVNVGAGPGRSFSIRYYAELICKMANYHFEDILWDMDKYVGVLRKELNTEKLNWLIGGLERKNLRTVLDDLILYEIESRTVRE